MALTAITIASDPGSQAHLNTAFATTTTRDEAINLATKNFGTAMGVYADALTAQATAQDAAIQKCIACHPQDAAIAAINASMTTLNTATAALKTAAAALVTATTT